MEQEPKIESRRESLEDLVSKLRSVLKNIEIQIRDEGGNQPNREEVNSILSKVEAKVG